ETCENAVALDCPLIMCAPGQNVGPQRDAIENLKRGGDICGKYGLKLAIEFNSQHDVINSITALGDILNGAGRPNAGMAARRLSSRAQRRRGARLRRRLAR